MLKLIKEHKIEFGITLLSIFLLIIYLFRFATIFDESYSLLLSHNSFFNIIKLDSTDVHPPLYYFILKIFVEITTFWTKSFLLKIISARILSVIVSLISFVYLIKICKELSIKNNIFLQWLLFLIIPGVISFTYEFIKIRMYSLGALFIIIQLYELIKYNKSRKNRYLIIITIMLLFSLYTNYYTAMISGLILIIYMINEIIIKQRWLNLFISGLISLVLFIPWIPMLLKQLSLQSHHSITAISSFAKQWMVTFILLLVFLYPLLWAHKYLKTSYLYKFYLYIFLTYLFVFLIMSIISVLFEPVFEFRYFYPVLLIYCFLGLNLYVEMLKQRSEKKNYLIYLLFSLLSIVCFGGYVSQIKYYGTASIQISNEFHSWANNNCKTVHLYNINTPDKGFEIEKSIYLSELGKKIVLPNTKVNNPTDIKSTYTSPSYKYLFSNMDRHIRM